MNRQAEKLRPALKDGHTAAEAAISLGELEAHIPAAEDDKMLGHPARFQQLDMCERLGLRQAGHRWNRGVGANIEKDPLARQFARAPAVQTDLNGFWCDEAPLAHDQLGAARFVAIQVHGDKAIDHLSLPLDDLRHIHGEVRGTGCECPAVAQEIDDFCAPDFVLAGQTGDVWTGAADPAALNDGRAMPGLRHMPGHELAARAASQHQVFI